MKFKFPMYLTMISALAFLTVDISEVQAQLESYNSAAPTTSMTTAAPAPVCCQSTSNYSSQSYYNVPQTGPIPSYRAVQFARNNPEATWNPHAESVIAAPVTHRGMTYVPLFSRSTNRAFFRFRRNPGRSAYSY